MEKTLGCNKGVNIWTKCCSVPPTEQGKRESGRFNQEVCSMEISTFTSKGNKEGRMLCVRIPKYTQKILPFNT
jgi:hypothetical protein